MNRKINSGVTISELRNECAAAEKHIAALEDILDDLKEVITSDKEKIADLEKLIVSERARFAEASETLAAFERIVAGTYLSSIEKAENARLVSDVFVNGLKSADTGEYDFVEPVKAVFKRK